VHGSRLHSPCWKSAMRGSPVNEASNVSTRKMIVATTKIRDQSAKGTIYGYFQIAWISWQPMESGQFMIASSCLSSI
jgi:hypothetical protein